MCVCVCSVVSDTLRPHILKPTKLLSPRSFPGKNTGVGCHFLFQRIFLTKGSNLCLLCLLCHPLLFLPAIFPSIRVFSNESLLRIKRTKYWHFSFNISPSKEYSGLISLGLTGWISLQFKELSRVFLNVIVTKASILQCSAFFIVQLSHPYMITGKTIALTRWKFVGKVMSLLFNMLSQLVITYLPRSKCL